MARSSYSKEERAWGKAKLLAMPQPLDAIPYTKQFDELFCEFNDSRLTPWTRPDFWKLLLAIRKQGLGGTRRPRIPAPKLNAKQQARLKELMPKTRGEVDRLPYTLKFDRIFRDFSKYISERVEKRDVWLACLHVAKAAISKQARPLLEKSIRRVRAAINAFNRIGGENRLDDAIITSHHAMEMLVKAGLLQKRASIIDPHTGHYLQFKPSLRIAVHDDSRLFLTHEDQQVLLAVDSARGDAYHGLLELDETEAFALISSSIDIFQKVLWEVFWKDLSDLLGSLVLPISTVPLADSAVLLDRKHKQIRSFLEAGEPQRALAAARSLAILEKASQGNDDARVTDKEVKHALQRIERDDAMQDVFPGIAGLPITQTDSGATIFIAVKRSGAAFQTDAVNHGAAVVAVKEIDPRDSHPFSFSMVNSRVSITRNQLIGVMRELKIKENPDFYHQHGPASGTKTDGYSPKAIEAIRKFAETYDGDLGELYGKHCNRKVASRKSSITRS
ncbi:MAG: hypothetical protein AAF711_00175 [Planctomycetota bacterium]